MYVFFKRDRPCRNIYRPVWIMTLQTSSWRSIGPDVWRICLVRFQFVSSMCLMLSSNDYKPPPRTFKFPSVREHGEAKTTQTNSTTFGGRTHSISSGSRTRLQDRSGPIPSLYSENWCLACVVKGGFPGHGCSLRSHEPFTKLNGVEILMLRRRVDCCTLDGLVPTPRRSQAHSASRMWRQSGVGRAQLGPDAELTRVICQKSAMCSFNIISPGGEKPLIMAF